MPRFKLVLVAVCLVRAAKRGMKCLIGGINVLVSPEPFLYFVLYMPIHVHACGGGGGGGGGGAHVRTYECHASKCMY